MNGRAQPVREPFRYRALQAWARTAMSVVVRRVDVTGVEEVPVDRPAILAANHSNALADVAGIVATTPRFPHFLAAASWWKSAPARLLFRWGGVVPIQRRQDSDQDTDGAAQNEATFGACHQALAEGQHLAIFPEGEMRFSPSLMPLKTGAARIALSAAGEAGVRGIALVPVGLVYDAPSKFRTVAEVHYGEPIEIDDWLDLYRTDEAKAVRGVTDLLADRLGVARVTSESSEASALLDRAAAFALAADADWPDDIPYARRNALRRALTRALARAGGETSDEYHALEVAVDAHKNDLAKLGIVAPNVVPTLTPATLFERSRLSIRLALLAPPGLLGLVANAPTLGLILVASRRVKTDGWQLTIKGVGASLLSPIVWTSEYLYLSRRLGRRRAVALVAVGAAGGLASIAWWEHYRRLRQIDWQDRAELEQPDEVVAARASRRVVRRRVEQLIGTRSRAGLE